MAVEAELTRILEGGESVDDLDVDVATIPWVFTGKGAAGTTVRALTRSETRVNVFGGVISRYARQSLESLPPERVRSVKDVSIARRLPVGELALVPLSLAGPGPVSAADVPPLQVRAVGVRGVGPEGWRTCVPGVPDRAGGPSGFRPLREGCHPMRAARVALFSIPLLALVACGDDPNGPTPTPTPTPTPCAPTTSVYATRVVESWIPASSLAQNIYNDPGEAVGAPDAGGRGPRHFYGFVSLGFGGHVTLDLGGCISDRDRRRHQGLPGRIGRAPVGVRVHVGDRALHAAPALLPGVRNACPRRPHRRATASSTSPRPA